MRFQIKFTMLAKRFYLVLIGTILVRALYAQSAEGVDFMRSIGKIYVVVAVIVAMFIGIVIFMLYIDRKLTKIEQQVEEHD